MNYQTPPGLPNAPVPSIPQEEPRLQLNSTSSPAANPGVITSQNLVAQPLSPQPSQEAPQLPLESPYNPEDIPTTQAQTPPIETSPQMPTPEVSYSDPIPPIEPPIQTIPQATQEIDLPFGEGEMFVSNSRLEGVAKCALMSALKLLGYRSNKAQPVMEAGTAIHEGIYEFLRSKDVEKVRAVVEAYYRPVVEKAEEVYPAYELHNILAIITEYCNRNMERNWPWIYDPAGIEVGFEAPLYGKVKVRGLIDILVRDKSTNQIAFVDVKSTGRIDSAKERFWSMSTQFAQYTHAIKEIYNEEVYGGFVEGVLVKKLPTDKKKCKEHAVPYHKCSEKHAYFKTLPVPQNPQKLANWKMTAIGLAQKLWALKKIVKDKSCLDQIPNQGMFNMSCQFCDFKSYCELGRQQRVLDTEYSISTFDPFEGRPMIKAGDKS